MRKRTLVEFPVIFILFSWENISCIITLVSSVNFRSLLPIGRSVPTAVNLTPSLNGLDWPHNYGNVSKMVAQLNGRNGTETLLCDVIVVLNIAAGAMLRFCFREAFRKVLDLNTNLILLGKWLRSKLFGEHYSLVFRRFLSNCGVATFHSEVTNRRYFVFFECKSTRLKRES